jgi:acyl-[acyl-carrier-protein] desaturase
MNVALMKTLATSMAASETLRDIEPSVGELLNAHTCKAEQWWPGEMLPRPYRPEDAGRLAQMQSNAAGIPPAARACIALNLVTEEGLPLFHQALAEMLPKGANFWTWLHRWTAEEDRHAHVISTYATLTGILDEVELDRMRFAYVRSGWEPGWDGDPYRVFVYTSLQERATQIAHMRTAALAGQYEETIGDFLRVVARDEARHFAFYRNVFAEILARDLDHALASAAAVMPLMAMPGGSMPQFRDLAEVASRSGIYTLRDYRGIVQELLRYWKIELLCPRTEPGQRSQALLLGIPERLTRIADRMEASRTARAFSFDVAFSQEFVL